MQIVMTVLKTIFGIGGEGSLVNKAVNGINNVALYSVVVYALTHVKQVDDLLAQQIEFRTSVGFLMLAAGVTWLVCFVAARSRPTQ